MRPGLPTANNTTFHQLRVLRVVPVVLIACLEPKKWVINRVVHKVWGLSLFLNDESTFDMSQMMCLKTGVGEKRARGAHRLTPGAQP